MTSASTSKAQHNLAIGAIFEDMLVPASRGVRTKLKVNGRPCFVEHQYDQTLAGDTWQLELTGQNPSRTVYFCEAKQLVGSSDELGKLYGDLGNYALAEIRQAHGIVLSTEEACTADSPGLAATLAQVARITTLPDRYRHDMAGRAWAIYEKRPEVEIGDKRFLELARIQAYTATDDNKEQALRYLLAMYENHHQDGDKEKARAMANLGLLLHKAGQFAEAVECYEGALATVEDSYVSTQLADCFAKLGRWEEAYKLIEHYPETHFNCVEGERNESRYDFVREPYFHPDHSKDDSDSED